MIHTGNIFITCVEMDMKASIALRSCPIKRTRKNIYIRISCVHSWQKWKKPQTKEDNSMEERGRGGGRGWVGGDDVCIIGGFIYTCGKSE